LWQIQSWDTAAKNGAQNDWSVCTTWLLHDKHSVGLSPYQYVLSERIGVAKEMLSKRELSIADVAFAVGFSDASQLNRVFRKLIGVTPTVYRRENGWG
jgi:AraC-like DNA-binding protein